ncbi:hypothetical protein L914_08919, partial [Phytophthora nicotianae]
REPAAGYRGLPHLPLEFYFGMLKGYFQLLEFLDVENDDIMEVLPSPASNSASEPCLRSSMM